ncbi:MAG: nucleotide exchange factor GrpE [Gemmatimonadota bacterium]
MTDRVKKEKEDSGTSGTESASPAEAASAPEGGGKTAGPGEATSLPAEDPLKELGQEVEQALAEELSTLKQDFESLNDRHLRLAAEFNNYRRRVEQERLDTWARAQADLVGRLLDVVDDLQRVAALDLSNATVEGIMEGIDLVERKFLQRLTEAGVEVIDPKPGDPFDPERMEAMMRVPAPSPEDDDTVDQVFQKGYAFRDQLVRPARVSVHKYEG